MHLAMSKYGGSFSEGCDPIPTHIIPIVTQIACSEPEVFVQQYVCGLQVTVNHRVLARVQIVHAFGNLWAWTVDDIKVERG